MVASAFFLATAYAGSPAWFNHGISTVETGISSSANLSAESCRGCHADVYSDWKTARHSVAWSNSIFHEGFLLESQDRCIYCHAPLREQFDEIKSTRTPALSHEGVTCVACHVRGGQVYSASSAGSQFHTWARDERLHSPEFCAGCHQFNFNQTIGGQTYLTQTVVQNTYQEWRDYQARGGAGTCQSCHMPGGRHLFAGAHSLENLQSAISLTVKPIAEGYEFRLTPVHVGHRVPTGDLFRHLTLEVAREGADFKTLASIGKIYGVAVDEATGEIRQVLKSDTSLGPFETRKIHYPNPGPIRYRLVYHFTSPGGERRSLLNEEALKTTVASGDARHETQNR